MGKKSGVIDKYTGRAMYIIEDLKKTSQPDQEKFSDDINNLKEELTNVIYDLSDVSMF